MTEDHKQTWLLPCKDCICLAVCKAKYKSTFLKCSIVRKYLYPNNQFLKSRLDKVYKFLEVSRIIK